MEIRSELKSAILNSTNICIMSHISPDGDGLGASFALGLALRNLGKEVQIVVEDEIPVAYRFLPGNDLVRAYEQGLPNFETAIVLDTGDEERIGQRLSLFKGARVTINIDHHVTNKEYADYNLVDVKASSAGEIVFFLLKDMGLEINKDIATNIYTAIMTDTGSFNYSNTTPRCHTITAELMEHGVDVSRVSQFVFESMSPERVKLTGEAVGTLEIRCNGKVAVASVTDEMLSRIGAKDEDCDGIVDVIRKVSGIEVAAFFRSKGYDVTRVNLRSKTMVDVSKIAQGFSGGGHERSAGCTIKAPLDEAKGMVLEEIEKALRL